MKFVLCQMSHELMNIQDTTITQLSTMNIIFKSKLIQFKALVFQGVKPRLTMTYMRAA